MANSATVKYDGDYCLEKADKAFGNPAMTAWANQAIAIYLRDISEELSQIKDELHIMNKTKD